MKQEPLLETLKEQLKPPFSYKNTCIVDTENVLFVINEKYGELVAAALNEKLERDFSEPLHWIKKCIYGMYVIFCPKCDFSQSMSIGIMDDGYKYCPSCGQKLLPPEGVKR